MTTDPLRLGVLGAVEARAGALILALPSGRARKVLALLVLNVGEVVPAEDLLEAVWGAAPPPSALAALQVYCSQLRKVLRPAAEAPAAEILSRRPGYVLRCDPEAVDVVRFRRLAREGCDVLRAGRPATASMQLRAALEQWRGPALADVADDGLLARYAASLEQERLQTHLARIEADLQLGPADQDLATLQSLALAHPLDEEVHRLRVLALYRQGHRAAALQELDAVRRRLRDELGVGPGPALRELHAAILREDEALETSAAEAGGTPDRRRSPRPVSATSLPLLGRDRQLAAVDEALQLLRPDAPVVVTIEGPPGAGKTRLLTELVECVAAGAVRHARASEASIAQPADVADQLELDHPPRPGAPLVLVVDDAHHADVTSLRALRRLIDDPPGTTLLLIAHRPLPGAGAGPLRRLREAARRCGELLELRLDPLTAEDLVAVTRGEALARLLLRASGGVPYHLTRTVDTALRARALRWGQGRLVASGTLPQPTSLPELLADATPRQRQLVEVVCVAARPVPIPVAAAVLGDEDAAAEVAEAAVSAGLLQLSSAGLAPVHDMAAAELADTLDETTRRRLYGVLAEAHRAVGDAASQPALVGRYEVMAGRPHLALPLLVDATLAAVESHAYVEAIGLADLALSALAGAHEPALEGRLRYARALGLMELGHMDEFHRVVRAAVTLLEGAEQVEALEQLASGTMDLAAHPEDAEETLAWAMAVASEACATRTRALLLTQWAQVLDAAGRVDEADRALARAGDLDTTDWRGPEAQYQRARVCLWRGEVRRADELLVRYMRAAARGRAAFRTDREPLRIWTLFLLGRVDEAVRLHRVCVERAERGDRPAGVVHASHAYAWGCVSLGRFADALAAADDELEIRLWLVPELEHMARAVRALALLGLGRLDEADDEVANAIKCWGPPEDQRAWSLLLRLLGLRVQAARGGAWPAAEAEQLTEQVRVTRRGLVLIDLLTARAVGERQPALALEAAGLAVERGLVMQAARAVTAAGAWDKPVGVAAARLLRGMADTLPPEWRAGWCALPEVAAGLRLARTGEAEPEPAS